MKNFRISLLHIDEFGHESSPRDAESHLIQVVTELEVFSLEVDRRLTKAELSSGLIEFAKSIK